MANEAMALSGFVQQYFQLINIVNKVRQSSQTLDFDGACKSSDGYTIVGTPVPRIVTPGLLRQLLKIQAESPPHLRLPVDPDEELCKYYDALSSITLLGIKTAGPNVHSAAGPGKHI